MYKLQEFIRTIDKFGVTDVLLPFFLIFGILYGIITKAKLLGERKGVHVTLSFVMAAIPVIFHITKKVPAKYDAIILIQEAIPSIALVMMAIISLLILLGIFGGEMKEFNFGAIGLWSAGIIGFFVVNSQFKNSSAANSISFAILAVIIVLSFKIGLPGMYDLIFSILICFVIYIFGRRMGWFMSISHLNNGYFWPMLIIIFIFSIVTNMVTSE